MASIIALGLAQVAKIASVQFIPPEKPEVKKFAKGSFEPLTLGDLTQTIFVYPEIIRGKIPGFAQGSDEPLTPGRMLKSFVVGYQMITNPVPGFSDLDIKAPADVNLLQKIFLNRKYADGSSRPLSPADVIQSVFTPPGESGLVAVQTGEFIVNRKATKEFSDVLRAMNAGQFQRPSIQRFQTGGPVGGSTPSPQSAIPPVTVTDLKEITDAIRDVKIVVRAELDAMRFFKENFSKFENNRNERRMF
jgi:hypothetical protein